MVLITSWSMKLEFVNFFSFFIEIEVLITIIIISINSELLYDSNSIFQVELLLLLFYKDQKILILI